MNSSHVHNRRAWDDRVRRGAWYIDTATEQDFKNPLSVIDPGRWLGGEVIGKRLLCLAAGGGRHSVLFAAAGARVTVVDLLPHMLELDRKIAGERNLEVRPVRSINGRLVDV
jgi:2-polyprenyl-3-methyl-5-hydroxy-6-metoxy-1,4-benzoquinol methylase